MRGLRWNVISSALNSFFCFVTWGGSVFILFLDNLGLNKTQIGGVQSFAPFCGLLALVAAPFAARFGFKRVFMVFYGTRKVVVLLLLLAPWVLARYGLSVATWFVMGTMFLFSCCRAIAETAFHPWSQEFIPNDIRGKFNSITNIAVTISSCAALVLSGFVIAHIKGMSAFMFLFAFGSFVGLVSVGMAYFIPGGEALRNAGNQIAHLRAMRTCMRDVNFVRFLGAMSPMALVMALLTFLPLFLKEQVGLAQQDIVWMDIAGQAGILVSSFLWGWLADRYGSRPTLMIGLSVVCIIPLCWILIPRHSGWSLPLAVAISTAYGIGTTGMILGQLRLMFNNVVPESQKTEYIAIWYACTGVAAGVGPLLAGYSIHLCRNVSGRILFVPVDSYTLLFSSVTGLAVLSLFLARRIRPDDTYTTRQIASGFFETLLSRMR